MAELSQNQFDALVVFTYNVGARNFFKSTLLHLINTAKLEQPESIMQIKAAFLLWNKAKGCISKGLIDRRNAEIKLFFTQ